MDAALAALLSPSRRRTTFSGARISCMWELGIGTGIFLLLYHSHCNFGNLPLWDFFLEKQYKFTKWSPSPRGFFFFAQI
jgi:hypothetical protein